MSECSLSGRGQGHVSNFYIMDLENFATASRRYTSDIHNSTVVGLFITYKTMKATRARQGWVHILITHRPTSTRQLHNFDLFRTCRTSRPSFCTVAWQLARFQLTQRIARSLGDSWASCGTRCSLHWRLGAPLTELRVRCRVTLLALLFWCLPLRFMKAVVWNCCFA